MELGVELELGNKIESFIIPEIFQTVQYTEI